MDNQVQDIINKANDNIDKLIEEIIAVRQSRDIEYCYHPQESFNNGCDSNCNKCKEEYYDKMYEDMKKKYSVNL